MYVLYNFMCGHHIPLRNHHRKFPERLHLQAATEGKYRDHQEPLHGLRVPAEMVRPDTAVQLDGARGKMPHVQGKDIRPVSGSRGVEWNTVCNHIFKLRDKYGNAALFSGVQRIAGAECH